MEIDNMAQDYLAECREHLATIETDLLALEQQGDEMDEQSVNRIFRAAHSIKGGAAFLGLSRIRELAHRTENVLELIRSRRMMPTPSVIGVLLLAFDKLREMLADFTASNEFDISEFVDGLTRLIADHLPGEQSTKFDRKVAVATPGGGRLVPVSVFDLEQARRSGRRLYLIQCDLIHDIQRRGKTPYDFIRTLTRSGTVLESVVDLESAGTLDGELSNELLFEVLYASHAEPAEIGQLLDIAPERVLRLECSEGESSETAAAVEPAPFDPASLMGTITLVPGAPGQAVVTDPSAESAPVAVSRPVPAALAAPADATIRLNVSLLDSLMTLAGELVLSRNQLNDSLRRQDARGIKMSAQRLSLATSELQETVSLTRMQPAGAVFSKFPRVVRDLARDLGKEVQLLVEGAEVELDKTIMEGLGDPLMHMVRNAVDHGIEPPDVRAALGKPRMGTIRLKASHHAGLVLIEVSDDGKGLDAEKVGASALARGALTREQLQNMPDRDKMALILLPGVSTAEKVSDISGRGVGMDVVKTNLDRMGGKMEMESVLGKGTRFRIKLPLTLAIIPSLLLSDGGERFAIAQVNVRELIRLRPAQIAERVVRVGDAEVLIVRDRLVPLLHLCETLGAAPRRTGQAWNVVIVDTGTFEYGLVVEALHDTSEIVVKPLGRHLKGLPDYAGATVLGDGRVAVILDVAGLAMRAGLSVERAQACTRRDVAEEAQVEGESLALLLFQNAPAETCAIPICMVNRIERIRPSQIEYLGGRRTMQYRNASLPLVTLADTASVGAMEESQPWVVIVFEHQGQSIGLLAAEPLDMTESNMVIDRRTLRQRGVAGSTVLKGRTTLIVDIHELVDATPAAANPDESVPTAEAADTAAPDSALTVLLAEDSDFFRTQIGRLLEGAGFRVMAAEDGEAAWELLDQHPEEVGLVTTDIEMPRMDGLALASRIRADGRFTNLPVIAVSALADEQDVALGLAAGITEYQVKLNQEELVKAVRRLADVHSHAAAAC